MKRLYGNNALLKSISRLMNHITLEMYTKDTILCLFRSLMETVIESRSTSIILMKINNRDNFEGLIKRLQYTSAKVFCYSEAYDLENFSQINLQTDAINDDEFIVIIDDRISSCLYWNENTSEVFGLCQGFCSFNPQDAKQIADYLQNISFSEELKSYLDEVKADRRRNEYFTSVIRKLVSSLESRQRDLICANEELTEICENNLQTEKMEAVGEFCSAIAHEIRNPLGSIDIYAKVIGQNAEKLMNGEHGHSIAQSIQNASNILRNGIETMDKILSELLNYSKPLQLERTKENVKETLFEAINLVRPLFEEKQINLNFHCELEDEQIFKADKLKIKQIIVNLLKNALEASNTGETVNISVNYEIGSDEITLKVCDEGCGIPQENAEKIFMPYFTTKNEGTGLGLAWSRKIAEAHKGKLFFIPSENKGSVFCLSIPAITD